jgi:hypothetical protein
MTAGALFDISLGDRPRLELAPGAVHVPVLADERAAAVDRRAVP